MFKSPKILETDLLLPRKHTDQASLIHVSGGGGGRVLGSSFAGYIYVCVTDLSEPLSHYSLFCGQL